MYPDLGQRVLEQLIKFDELELDLGCYQLRRNGNVLKLEKAPMELLILLVAKKGQLVSREEIIEKLCAETFSLTRSTESKQQYARSGKS